MRKHRLPGVPARGSFETAGNAAALFVQLPYPENDRERQPAKTANPTQAASKLCAAHAVL
jgi:hypothetical protein